MESTPVTLANGDSDTHLRKRCSTQPHTAKEEGNGEGAFREGLKSILKDALREKLPNSEVSSVAFEPDAATETVTQDSDVSKNSNQHDTRESIEITGKKERESETDSSTSLPDVDCEAARPHCQARAKRILRKGWILVKRAFDTKAAPGRRTGFRRIDPAQARRIRDEYVCNITGGDGSADGSDYETIEEYESRENDIYKIETISNVRRRRRLRAKSLKKQRLDMLTFGKKRFEAEKVLIILCALFIVVGYPLCYYLHFYKRK